MCVENSLLSSEPSYQVTSFYGHVIRCHEAIAILPGSRPKGEDEVREPERGIVWLVADSWPARMRVPGAKARTNQGRFAHDVCKNF